MARGGRLKSGLVIPSMVSSVKPPAFVCRVIVDGEGNLCGKQFTDEEGRAYQRHVTRCAKQHHAEIVAQSKRVRMPGLFGEDAFDPEAERWVREHAQEIIEGRLSFYGKRKRMEFKRPARR